MAVIFHAYPYAGYQTTEAEYSRLLDAALGSSGLLEAAAFTMSGMTLTSAALDGIIRGHRFTSGVGTFDLASTTSARVALLGAKLEYGATPIVKPFIKYGATTPAPVQTRDGVYEIPLWSVSIPANATTLGAGQVTSLWTRLRSPSQSMIYVQSERPENPPVNSVRIW